MFYVNKLSLNIPDTVKPRVVVVGGGFGGVNLVKKLSEKNCQVVLLDRQNYNGFWPLLYQVATAGLEPDSIAEPLRKMFRKGYEDFHFRLVRVTGVNPTTRTITTLLGDLTYDYLVIATGTKSNFFGNEKIKQFALPLKRVRHALDIRSQILQVFEQANMINDETIRQGLLNIVIAGAGPTGVELAGALSEMRKHILPRDYPGIDFTKMNIYVAEGLDRVLPLMSLQASKKSHRYLQKMGVVVKLNTRVESYDGEAVRFNNGEEIQTQTLIWAAGVTGIIIEGLPADTIQSGRIIVNQFNQVMGSDNIFAIGDIALMRSKKYPKGHPGIAQPAIQQGKHLARNLNRLFSNKPMKPFSYFDKGTLAIIGRSRAVADLPGNLHLSGFFAWMTWLFVHIYYSIGFRNKLVVISNWTYRFFTYQRGNRLIITSFVRKEDKAGQEFVTRNQEE
jgi:NADH:ubiquinone reductase (H+-translocating)